MQKIVWTYLAASLLSFFPSESFASSLLMGRIFSVHPYGASDAARNPALLVRQKQNDTIGLLLDYQTSLSIKNYSRSSNSVSRVTIGSFDSGISRFSYINNMDTFALGFDVYANYEYTKVSQQSYFQTNGFDTLGKGPSTRALLVTAFTISAGIALDADNSFGIQISTVYYKNTQSSKTRSLQLSFFPVLFSNSEKTIQEQIIATPGIGYLGKIENTEIGLMLTVGRLAWEKDIKEKENYVLSSFFSQINFKAKGELPFSFLYTAGPGIIAGAYTRPVEIIGIGLELEITFPVTYQNQYLVPLKDSFFYIKSSRLQLENKISSNPFVSLRGGFEFFVLRNAVLSIGGGLGYTDAHARTHGKWLWQLLTVTEINRIYNRVMTVYGTMGVDFLLGKRHILTVGTSLAYTTQSNEEERLQQPFPTANLELNRNSMKIKPITIDLLIMMSFGF